MLVVSLQAELFLSSTLAHAGSPKISADRPTALAAQVGAPTISADTPTALAA